MRVVVVDDEPLARSGVMARLASSVDVEVAGEYAGAAEALAALPQAKPDLIFVDIQMPGMNGLDMIASIEAVALPMVILLTAHEEFALRAFALNVLDYLLKPIDDDRFHEALERARHAFRYRLPERKPAIQAEAPIASFTVRSGNRIAIVHAQEVDWIEAQGDYACLHAGGAGHLVRETLSWLAQRLDRTRFARVHRSTIVNLERVAEIRTLANRDALLRLEDGTPVRVSRTYVEPMLKAMRDARKDRKV